MKRAKPKPSAKLKKAPPLKARRKTPKITVACLMRDTGDTMAEVADIMASVSGTLARSSDRMDTLVRWFVEKMHQRIPRGTYD